MAHIAARVASICVAFFAYAVFQSRKRSRHISTSTRRAIIERDLPAGESYPQRHHIDHIWPHARAEAIPPIICG